MRERPWPTKPNVLRGLLFFPASIGPEIPSRGRDRLIEDAKQRGIGRNVVPVNGPGFVGVDGDFGSDPKILTDFMDDFFRNRVRPSELHLDVWPTVFIHDTKDAEAQIAANPGERYSLPPARRVYRFDPAYAAGRPAL